MAGILRVLGLTADEYAVCLVGGGASLQFTMLPMNFLGTPNGGQTAAVADYIDSGEWGAKAVCRGEAIRHGQRRRFVGGHQV